MRERSATEPVGSGGLRDLRAPYLGLAFVHMWIYCSTHRPSLTDDVSVMIVMYLALSALLVGVFLALRAGWRVGRRSEAARRLPEVDSPFPTTVDIVCAILMAASGVLLAIPVPLPETPVVACASVAGGVGMGWAYLRWVQLYARLDIHFSAPLVLVTMALGSAGKTVVDYLPDVPAAIVLGLLPFATLACLASSFATVPSGGSPLRYFNRRAVSSLVRLAIGVAVYSLAIGIIQAVLLETTSALAHPSVLVHHGSEVVLALVLLAWTTVLRRGLNFNGTWRIISVLMATALIFLPYIDPSLMGYLLSLIRTAQTYLIVILFLALADVARHGTYHPMVVFSAGWFAYALPFAVGNAVGSGMAASGPDATVAMSLIVWVLILVTFVALDESSMGNRLIFAELNDEGDEDTLARHADDVQQSLERSLPATREWPAVAGVMGADAGAMGMGADGSVGGSAPGNLVGGLAGNGVVGAGARLGGGAAGSGVPASGGRGIPLGATAAIPGGAPGGVDLLSLRCDAVARAYGLTSREREILELLARGRSKTHIAEAFFISENTVRGHVKHIYAKLDVHGKQELLDKIESQAL